MAVLQTVPGVSGQEINVIDVESLTQIGQVQIDPGGLASTTISIADNGTTVAYVVYGVGGGSASLVNVTTDDMIAATSNVPYGIAWLRLNPAGTIVAHPQGFAAVIESTTSHQVNTLGLDNRVVSATWSPTGSRLAIVTSPIRPDFFEGATAQIFSLAFNGNELTSTVDFAIQPAGGTVAWSRDATRIAVARDQGFDIYDTASASLLMQVDVAMSDQRTLYPLAWSQDGTQIAGGTEAGVAVWDVSTGVEVAYYPGHYPMALAWRSDGSLLQMGHEVFLDNTAITIGDIPPNSIHTPTPSPMPSATPTLTLTPTPFTFQRLRLTSLCSANPAAYRLWRIRNSNPVDVVFTWDIYRSPSGQNGFGVAPPAVGGVASEVIISTVTEAGPNTLRLFVDGAQQDVKASSGATCPP
jgi:WD40 repeat protein